MIPIRRAKSFGIFWGTSSLGAVLPLVQAALVSADTADKRKDPCADLQGLTTMTRKLTKADLNVLRVLQRDGTLSGERVGEKVSKDGSTVWRTRQRLQEEGVITGIHAAVDPHKLGLATTVFTLVALKRHGDGLKEEFERRIDVMVNIVDWSCIGGSWDYLLKFVLHDTAHYDRLHNELLALPMVSRLRGMHVIGKSHAKPTPIPSDPPHVAQACPVCGQPHQAR